MSEGVSAGHTSYPGVALKKQVVSGITPQKVQIQIIKQGLSGSATPKLLIIITCPAWTASTACSTRSASQSGSWNIKVWAVCFVLKKQLVESMALLIPMRWRRGLTTVRFYPINVRLFVTLSLYKKSKYLQKTTKEFVSGFDPKKNRIRNYDP